MQVNLNPRSYFDIIIIVSETPNKDCVDNNIIDPQVVNAHCNLVLGTKSQGIYTS